MPQQQVPEPVMPKGAIPYNSQEAPNPSPIQLNPSGPQMPFGAELYVPQTETDFNKEVAPLGGRAFANFLPMLLSIAGSRVPYGSSAGAAAGTGASMLLRNSMPELFGEPPKSGLSAGIEFGEDQLLNSTMPWLFNKSYRLGTKLIGGVPSIATLPGIRSLPGVREAAAESISRQIGKKYVFPESQIIESAAENAGTQFGDLTQNVEAAKAASLTPKAVHLDPAVIQAEEELSKVFGRNKIGHKLVKLDQEYKAGRDVAKTQEYKDIANLALKDLIHGQNWLLATGRDALSLEQLALNKVLTEGFQVENETLNATKIFSELNGANREIYQQAIRPTTMKKLNNLLGEIQLQQTGHGTSDAILRWSKGHLLWALGGFHAGLGPVGMSASAVNFGNKALVKALQNPQTADLMLAAMRTPVGSPKASLLQRALAGSLQAVGAATTVPEK